MKRNHASDTCGLFGVDAVADHPATRSRRSRRRLRDEFLALGSASVTIVTFSIGFPDEAYARRPFVSTDADVVKAREVELELGVLTIESDTDDTAYVAPSIVLNFGLSDRLELVGEFDGRKAGGESWRIDDPGLFLKWLAIKGPLQDRPGVSVALEAGALLPQSGDGEKGPGGEVILIASAASGPLVYHLNLGGGVDRTGEPFWLWGAIGEFSLSPTLTLAAELEGEEPRDAAAERSVLLGARFQPEGSAVLFDMGLRRGLTGATADWSATFGLTTAF